MRLGTNERGISCDAGRRIKFAGKTVSIPWHFFSQFLFPNSCCCTLTCLNLHTRLLIIPYLRPRRPYSFFGCCSPRLSFFSILCMCSLGLGWVSCLFCACVVQVFVLLVGWSVICCQDSCFKVSQKCIARRVFCLKMWRPRAVKYYAKFYIFHIL